MYPTHIGGTRLLVDSRFEWWRSVNGYGWSEEPPDPSEEGDEFLAGSRTMLWLTKSHALTYRDVFRTLRPIGTERIAYFPIRDAPNLFLELAECVPQIPTTRDAYESSLRAIETFAGRFGPLVGDARHDEWGDWAGVVELSIAVGLWRSREPRARAAVSDLIRNTHAPTKLRKRPLLNAFAVAPSSATATAALEESINDRMRLGRLLQVQVVDAKPIRQLEPIVVPTSLIGAAWGQLLEAVTEGHSFKRCRWCKRPFRIRARMERRSKEFCDKSCANMASRKRRKG